jgi:hypothetical protein
VERLAQIIDRQFLDGDQNQGVAPLWHSPRRTIQREEDLDSSVPGKRVRERCRRD